MKNLLIGFVLFILAVFVPVAHAQVRVLGGITGSEAFDNSSLGVAASLEIPFAKHFELDLQDSFSPLESHVSLGGGRANIASADGRVWFSQHFGLIGGAEDSSYNVTKVTKDADYARGGLAYRGIVGGLPARFDFSYLRQFNNGVTPSGLESSHLQGLDIGYTMRFGCFGPTCIRMSEDIVAGVVKLQGNPVCDGSLGVTGGPNGGPCPRGTSVGGGFSASVTLEFPRHKSHEYDIF